MVFYTWINISKCSAEQGTYTDYFMIAHNFPHAVHDKCNDHERQHDSKYYNDDENMLWLCFAILLQK